MNFFAVIIIIILLLLLIISIFMGIFVQKKAVSGGDPGIIGSKGKCIKRVSESEGKIFVNGEYWNAIFQNEINEGDRVIVVDVKDNFAYVKRIEKIEKDNF